jgi:uncharacterized cupin superfamily protein
MPRLDLDNIAQTNATGYPPEHAAPVQGRWYRRLAVAGGLEDFGASHVVLEPGAWSAQRHWHVAEDELVAILAGEAVLVDDSGETPLHAGDVAVFPKNDGNGHVLQNRSGAPCTYIAIGRPSASDCHYPDIDMHLFDGLGFRRKDGSAF